MVSDITELGSWYQVAIYALVANTARRLSSFGDSGNGGTIDNLRLAFIAVIKVGFCFFRVTASTDRGFTVSAGFDAIHVPANFV